jgi:hypothetical protein
MPRLLDVDGRGSLDAHNQLILQVNFSALNTDSPCSTPTAPNWIFALVLTIPAHSPWFNCVPLIVLCVSQRAAAHCSNGFVECRKNPRLAGRRGDAMSVHVGPQVLADTREDHDDPLAR